MELSQKVGQEEKDKVVCDPWGARGSAAPASFFSFSCRLGPRPADTPGDGRVRLRLPAAPVPRPSWAQASGGPRPPHVSSRPCASAADAVLVSSRFLIAAWHTLQVRSLNTRAAPGTGGLAEPGTVCRPPPSDQEELELR